MQAQKDTFIKGSLEKGFDNDIANEIFDLIEPFAGYAFNKAHSVSYAMIAYWTAYFKANYKIEYFTSLLNSYISNFEKISDCITEIRKTNITIKNPSINYSNSKFSIEEDTDNRSIRFGLSSLKNVGLASVEKIINERQQNGIFNSLEEFLQKNGFRLGKQKSFRKSYQVW